MSPFPPVVREEQSQAAISTQAEPDTTAGPLMLDLKLAIDVNQRTSPTSPTCRLRSKLKCSHQEFLISLSVKPRS